jgi:hypothetical protein
MTVDVRAHVFCNLGTIISGNIADEALSVGQGLISCRGQLVLAGLSTPAVGSVVNIGWERDGTIARLPRTLRVLSSFANPFTRQTTVQLGDKLVYLANLKGKKAEEEEPAEDGSNGPDPNVYPSDEYDWQVGDQCYLPKAGAKPYNFSDPKAASQLTVRENYALAPAKVMNRAPMGITASSVLQKCCAALGIAFSGTLTNTYQDDFDLSAGYVSVLDQLISSESYFGYLNESETLVLRGWDGTGPGPLLDENSVIELSGINSGVLPGQVVSVTFDSKRLEQTAAEEAQQELDDEDAAQATIDDPTSTAEEEAAAQAELDALAEEKQLRDWERDEAVTYNQEYDFYVQDDAGAIVYTLSVAHNPRSVTLSYYDESDYKTKAITTEERIFAGELGSILQAKLNALYAANDVEELRLLPQVARQELLFRTEEYLEYETIKQEEIADSLPLDPDLLCPDPDGEQRVADEDAEQEKRVEKQQVRQTVKRFEPIEALIGKLNIGGIDWGEFDLSTLPSGEYEAERTVITYDTNQPEGQTKTRTDRYLAYGLTQNGQQDTAEKGQVTTDLNGLNDLLTAAKRLVFEGTTMAIQQDRTFGVQQRPRTEARQEALKEKQAPVGATNDEGRQQVELEQENSTVESKPKTELEMPLASDDAVVWTASDGYEFVGSNAMGQAMRYARTQNAVMYGNRAGVSLQVPAYVMPLYPLSSVYLQAAGLTAAYKANGLSWSFNSDGILGAMDALYAGAVSGSGTFWMPVAPGITSLPSDPTVSTGTGAPANSTTTPGGFDPVAPGAVFASLPTGQAPSYAQSIAPTALVPYVNESVPLVAGTRTALSVTALDYALTLPTGTAVLVTKTELQVAVRLAAVAAAFNSNGQDAALSYTKAIRGLAGAFALAGYGAGSVRDYRIGTNYGTFTVSGQNAVVALQRAPLAAAAGAFALSGQDAQFAVATSFLAGAGSFTVSGQASTTTRSYLIGADAGTFSATGQAAQLTVVTPQFATVQYTGNGSEVAVTGVGFKPGMVWIIRSSVSQHVPISDSLRGANKYWQFGSVSTEATGSASDYVVSFDSDGFTVGGNAALFNSNTASYHAMCWKEGASAVTNTDGANESQVMLNSGLGLSIFTFTGSTSLTGTVGHGLGAQPDFLWVKQIGIGDEAGYLRSATYTGGQYSSLTSSNLVASSTNVFTALDEEILSFGATIRDGKQYVGYAVKSVAGVSDHGTYSGSLTTTTLDFGFTPRFVIIKSITGSSSTWGGHWMETGTTGNPLRKSLNLTSAPSTVTTLAFTSTGVEIDGDALDNKNGATYLYMAWA